MTATPASLLERLRRPFDAAAWERFVALYTPLIYAWARQAGLQEPDADDLVQEVFVTLLQTMPSFVYDRHQSFRRWLRAVTLNKWRDRRKRRAEPLLENAELLPDRADLDGEPFWEAEYRQRLANRALQVMQSDFQPTTWRAFWEHAVGGRPAPAVAAELGLTPGAVYAAKLRVLDRLRRELQGMLE